MRGPRDDCRYPQSAFQQFSLPAGEGASIPESFPAVVTGEYNYRVVRQTVLAQRFKNTDYLKIHLLNHALIRLLRASIEIKQSRWPEAVRFCLVTRRFPGPVRRVEMQTHQKRAA